MEHGMGCTPLVLIDTHRSSPTSRNHCLGHAVEAKAVAALRDGVYLVTRLEHTDALLGRKGRDSLT
eukprot:17849-Prymnesium_polylepis.1